MSLRIMRELNICFLLPSFVGGGFFVVVVA
jgi:hypothetical protein